MANSPLAGSDGTLSLTITCDGVAIPESVRVVSITTNHGTNRIPSAFITVLVDGTRNVALPVADHGTFTPGARVDVGAGYGVTLAPIFTGVVARHSVRIGGAEGARLIIECRDPALAMTVNRNTARYADLTDQQIIAVLIGSYPALNAAIADTAVRHEAVLQSDLTDWDYMLERAGINGLLVTVDGGKVTVAAPAPDAAPVLAVTYGIDLIEFDGEFDASARLASGTAAHISPAQAHSSGRLVFQGSALARSAAVLTLAGIGEQFDGNVIASNVAHRIADGNWTTTVEFGIPTSSSAPASRKQATRWDAAGAHSMA